MTRLNRSVILGFAAACMTLSDSGALLAQCVNSAPIGAPLPEDGWGQSVAISANGTTAIVGGPFVDHDINSESAGAVRMLVNTGGAWVEQGSFTGGSFAPVSNLGWSVDISADGNTAVAGQPKRTTSNFRDGLVRVYVRDVGAGTWSQQTIRYDPTPNGDGYFGWSVSLSDDGNTLVVAQPGSDITGNAGGAYVYTRSGSTWSTGVALVPTPAPVPIDAFASCVAISPDGLVIAVGAPGRVNGPMSQGAVYVFRKVRGVWTQDEFLTSTVAYLGPVGLKPRFGHAVALDSAGGSETLAVGDPFNSELLTPSFFPCSGNPQDYCPTRYAGCVYLYQGSGGAWSLQRQIFAPDVQYPVQLDQDLDDRFGSSVAVRGSHLVVGAPGDEDCGGEDCQMPSNGSVYRFTSGQMLQKLTHTHVYTNDEFGTSVDVSADGQVYIAGAPRGDSPGVNFTGTVDIADSNISYPMIGVEPTQSAFEITITFPGNDPPPQTFTIHLTGRLNGLLSTDCSGEPTAIAVLDYDGLHTVEQEITVALPGNESLTFGQADITTVVAGHAALLDPQGDGLLRGYTLGAEMPLLNAPGLAGDDDCQFDCTLSPTTPFCVCSPLQAILDFCLGFFYQNALAGESSNLTVTGLDINSVMNLGMGANNPTIHITGGINVPLPCPADIAPTGGDNTVNVTDLLAVISAWGACGDPENCPADTNNDDTVNVTDLLAVISDWGACP